MSEAKVEAALGAGRRVAVKVDAAWCSMCRELDRDVLEAPAGKRLLEGVALVRVDFDADDAAPLVERLAILELPTLVVLAEDGAEVGRVVGYGDPAEWRRAAEGAVAADDPLPALRAAADDPADRAAAFALGDALLARDPDEGQARLEALAWGDDAWAERALHHLGRFRHRARRDPAAALPLWRDLALRFADGPYATDALTWYARGQAALGRPEAGAEAFATRHEARPGDVALVRAWARFVGRQALEPARVPVRDAAVRALAHARGRDRDDLENLALSLAQPLGDAPIG